MKWVFLMVFGGLSFLLMAKEGHFLSKKEIDFLSSEIKVVQKFRPFITKAYDYGDLYYLTLATEKGKISVYITKDKKYTFLGSAINNIENLIVTMPKMVKNIDETVALSYGKGKDIYLITDPSCPFCIKFFKLSEERNLGEKYKVNVILYPLPSHKESKKMIAYILHHQSDSERLKAYKEVMTGLSTYKNFSYTSKEEAEVDNYIAKSYSVLEELEVGGTPYVFDKTYKKIDWMSLFKE